VPRVSFVSESARNADNIAAQPARLLNFYPAPIADQGNGRTAYVLKSVLGQDNLSGFGAAVRALGRANDKMWAVAAGRLHEVATDGTTTERGTVADDALTTIAGNYGIVTVVAGNNYYTWNGSTVAQPSGKTFTNVGSHCYVGGYTVLTEKAGRRFQWSALGDATSLNALHFASADKVDDNLLRAVEFRGNLILFGETSAEVWSINPDATLASARFVWADTANTGLKAFGLIVRFDDALFWVGNDNVARIWGQGEVSTTAVERDLAKAQPTDCVYYEDEGHKFCAIRFADRPAWVYDITTGLWHERGETAGFLPWRVTATLRNGAGWIAGTTAGALVSLARTNRDLDAPLTRQATSRSVYLGDRPFRVDKVELLARVGEFMVNNEETFALGLGVERFLSLGGDNVLRLYATPSGERDAQVALSISRNGGQTWTPPKIRSMGRKGDFERRMTWQGQGQAQQCTFRFETSEPVDISLYADGFVTAR
jgi:hypothetical protein